MTVSFSNTLKDLPATCILPIIANERLAEILEQIAQMSDLNASLLQADFKAEQGDVQTIYQGEKRFYLLGLGKGNDFSKTVKTFRSFAHKIKDKSPSKIGLGLFHCQYEGKLENLLEAAVNGLELATYQIGHYKNTSKTEAHPLKNEEAGLVIGLTNEVTDSIRQAVEKGHQIAQAQLSIMELVNMPGNKKTPTEMASWALRLAQESGYKATVFEKAQIEEIGLHALLAVNRGSEYPPVFIVLEYTPSNVPLEGLKTVGLVGKGVTFDTGGISIKPSANMHYMKSDMGGAAAVLGTFEAAARLQLPVRLVGAIPVTDNAVDAKSIRPGDVIDSYSGKTIEVIDTDAEGRLILADGLAYILKHFQPDTLIDAATLTGSTVRTFGYQIGGLFSNNDDLAEALFQAGERTGERIWRLPIWDIFNDDIKSDIADVRNYSGKPTAGAIGAAKFLEAFINDHPRWAHLDIAGVAFGDSEFSSQKSATGFGIRLLVDFLMASIARPKSA
ncbi:MAG TPA: leucyl aminopeptidase [Saprospiraceae bacterium]|nr:leucyl aminopeptidase [Saprospiraceae bacterium]HMQ83313.1 leucyl aminopeptidase [Saprospiraceae bacterium]